MPLSRIKLLWWRTEDERVNFLNYPFFLTSISYSLGFLFLESAANSSLYQDMIALNPAIPHLWALVLLFVGLAAFFNLMYRRQTIGSVASIIGFMAWIFATFMWGYGGNPTVLFAVGLPQVIFWAWYYLQVISYHRRVDQGLAPDDAEMVVIMRERAENARPSEPKSSIQDPPREPPIWPGPRD